MAHTDRDELDRVPTFTEQQRRARGHVRPVEPLPPAPASRTCLTCGAELPPDALRFRCTTCPPKPIPAAFSAAVERLRARQQPDES